MTNTIHPAAAHHLPIFITPPGESDVFLIGCAIFLVFAVLGAGSLYFRLHALPEHMAHGKANKLQLEVVAVLALLALFTHNNWFWVAALLLALVPIPDLHAPLVAMADSLTKMAGIRRPRTEGPAEEIEWASPSPENPPPVVVTTNANQLNDASYQASSDKDPAAAGTASGKPPHAEPKEKVGS